MFNAVKIGNEYDYNYREFVCDTIEDLHAIKTRRLATGSKATVLKGEGDKQQSYVLTGSREWIVDTATGGGSVQPDWSQNDETAADYVKNRPGGYSEFREVGSPKSLTVSCTDSISGGFRSAARLDVYGKWGSALTARITYDGDEYICKRQYTTQCFGDENLVEYPFALDVQEYIGGGSYEYYDYAKTSGDHEITVTSIQETAIPIPEKYMTTITTETFPEHKRDIVTRDYGLLDYNRDPILEVYSGAAVPRLELRNKQWFFPGLGLIICNTPTFKLALTEKEIFTGIVIKKDSSHIYGLVIDLSGSGQLLVAKEVSELPAD